MSSETLQEWARRLVAEHAIPEPNTGCFLWTRATAGKGYASARYQGKLQRISRALLGLPALTRSSVRSANLCACHRCDTPLCVNEAHLFAGTLTDNVQDALNKGRHRYGTLGRDPHCIHGHPLFGENARVLRSGKRVCRACKRECDRRFWARRLAARNARLTRRAS